MSTAPVPNSSEAFAAALADSETAWLCTVRPDGTPHQTPVWFVFRADTVWVCCTTGSVKARNLRADQRVSMALGDGACPVVLEGTARLYEHQPDFPAAVRRAFAEKYDGWDILTLEQGRWPRVLARIPVSRWLLSGVAQEDGLVRQDAVRGSRDVPRSPGRRGEREFS